MTQQAPQQTSAHSPHTKHIKIQRDSLIRLQQYEEKRVIVKFAGGREISGVMRSFDRQLNLTLDHAVEVMAPGAKRELGFVIVRGTLVMPYSNVDSYHRATGWL
jgi:U6 snRNA-associated Sm-like protein LSm7